jgi:hypothetical protein
MGGQKQPCTAGCQAYKAAAVAYAQLVARPTKQLLRLMYG